MCVDSGGHGICLVLDGSRVARSALALAADTAGAQHLAIAEAFGIDFRTVDCLFVSRLALSHLSHCHVSRIERWRNEAHKRTRAHAHTVGLFEIFV